MIKDPHSGASQVRHFEARDVPAMGAIARESPQAAAWAEKSYEEVDREGQCAWVVESGDKLCGFLIARKVAADEAEILNLAVETSNRRAGNATALLGACIAELSRVGVRRVFLEVRESNAPAISFYQREKFVRTGRRPGYYQNPSEAAVLLVKELPG
jgi:[ribosomal protein S18]-alanine N-acetyltransferase